MSEQKPLARWADSLLAETAPPSGADVRELRDWLLLVLLPSLSGQSPETVQTVYNALLRRLTGVYGLPESFLALCGLEQAFVGGTLGTSDNRDNDSQNGAHRLETAAARMREALR